MSLTLAEMVGWGDIAVSLLVAAAALALGSGLALPLDDDDWMR